MREIRGVAILHAKEGRQDALRADLVTFPLAGRGNQPPPASLVPALGSDQFGVPLGAAAKEGSRRCLM